MSVTSHLILIYMWTQFILGGADIYSMIFMDVRFQIGIHSTRFPMLWNLGQLLIILATKDQIIFELLPSLW